MFSFWNIFMSYLTTFKTLIHILLYLQINVYNRKLCHTILVYMKGDISYISTWMPVSIWWCGLSTYIFYQKRIFFLQTIIWCSGQTAGNYGCTKMWCCCMEIDIYGKLNSPLNDLQSPLSHVSPSLIPTVYEVWTQRLCRNLLHRVKTEDTYIIPSSNAHERERIF